MIPKIIHYCWYGRGNMPSILKRCLESWSEKCPDYEIRRWDETNSPMDIPWIKDAYACGKYAFVADYMRFYILYHYGGVYLDTDMLLIKSLDDLLCDEAFLGREDVSKASMGIIGAIKGHHFCKECLDFYDSSKFDINDLPIITIILTPLLEKYGYKYENINQLLSNGLRIYATSYFYPVHYKDVFDVNDLIAPPYGGFVKEDAITYSIHLWYKSWAEDLEHLHMKHYKVGFSLAWKRIKENPRQPLKYYKKLLKYFVKMMIRY